MRLHAWTWPVFLLLVKAGAGVWSEITMTLGTQQPFTSHRDPTPPPSREQGQSLTLSSCSKKTAAGFCFCFILIFTLL